MDKFLAMKNKGILELEGMEFHARHGCLEREKIAENLNALMDAIVKAKPAAAKGQYIKSVTVTSTMGPGVKVNYNKG